MKRLNEWFSVWEFQTGQRRVAVDLRHVIAVRQEPGYADERTALLMASGHEEIVNAPYGEVLQAMGWTAGGE